MLKLLISRCARCSKTGAHSDHFLLHINTKCNRRLQDRREAMSAAGKKPVVANCATAREMACWVWAIARMAVA